MRKQASILLCLLVLMITLTGCLGQGEDKQTQEEIDEELIIEIQETDTDKEQEELKEYYEELDEQREDDLAELNELLNGGEATLEDCEKFEDAEIKKVCATSVGMLGEN